MLEEERTGELVPPGEEEGGLVGLAWVGFRGPDPPVAALGQRRAPVAGRLSSLNYLNTSYSARPLPPSGSPE